MKTLFQFAIVMALLAVVLFAVPQAKACNGGVYAGGGAFNFTQSYGVQSFVAPQYGVGVAPFLQFNGGYAAPFVQRQFVYGAPFVARQRFRQRAFIGVPGVRVRAPFVSIGW